MSEYSTNVPKIRFPGFTDAWEQRKLGEVAKITMGQAPNGENYTENLEDHILVQGNADIKNGWVVPRVWTTQVTKTADKGDIILSVRAPVGDVGKTQYDVVIGRGVAGIKGNEFIFQTLNKMKSSGFWTRYSSGSTFESINSNDLNEALISIPEEAEQTKIGNFFNQLDHLITLHQRKLNHLQDEKKSLLQKMFPKDGADVPEIRFPGFIDAWEQREFTNITYPAGEKNKENLPLESYSISNEKGFVPQDEQFENGGTMREADKRMYYIVQPNSFAYNPARINVGSIGYYDLRENVIVSSLYEVFKTTDDVDDRFLWHWFKTDRFQYLIEQYQEGGVRLYFYYDKLCKCSIHLPKIEEQKQIGQFMDRLDNLITLHQRKLNHLQEQKKSLLQQMFV